MPLLNATRYAKFDQRLVSAKAYYQEGQRTQPSYVWCQGRKQHAKGNWAKFIP